LFGGSLDVRGNYNAAADQQQVYDRMTDIHGVFSGKGWGMAKRCAVYGNPRVA
jgi:hypothetical protein